MENIYFVGSIISVCYLILSILDNSPLLNEPGVTKDYKDVPIYNEIIKYKNIDFSILEMVKDNTAYRPKNFDVFLKVMKKHFEEHKERTKEIIDEKRKLLLPQIFQTSMYSMSTTIDYNSLLKKI